MRRKDLRPGMEIAVRRGRPDHKGRWQDYGRDGPPPCERYIVLSNRWWVPAMKAFWDPSWNPEAILLSERRIPCAVEIPDSDGEWHPAAVDPHRIYDTWKRYEAQVKARDDAAQARRDRRANAVAELRSQVPEGVELYYEETDEYGRENPTTNPDHLLITLTVADMRRILENR